MRSFGGEELRHSGSDSPAAPGDDCSFVRKVEIHRSARPFPDEEVSERTMPLEHPLPLRERLSLNEQVAIVALLNRYATALDTRNWDLLAGCFTKDATFDYPVIRLLSGNRAFAEFMRQAFDGLDATQHIVTNHVVVLKAGEVQATSYFQAQHYRAGAAGGSTFTAGGRYHDRLVQERRVWKNRNRVAERMWTSGNAALRSNLAELAKRRLSIGE